MASFLRLSLGSLCRRTTRSIEGPTSNFFSSSSQNRRGRAMAMVANLALLLDLSSPWSSILDRKARSPAPEFYFTPPKKELHAHGYAVSKSFDSEGENRKSERVVARGSGANGADFGSDSSDDDEGWFDEDDESVDWEEELRSKVKDIEEMKELELKAEEVRKRVEEEMRLEGREESEEVKRERVRRELEKAAKEQLERRATAELMFDLGQKAYGRGKYGRSIKFLEAALTIIPKLTLLGGEIQIWLAMAYAAANRNEDCIDVYRELEKDHPSGSIRRQATNLRYIAEAPKIKITEEELVSFPDFTKRLYSDSYDRYDRYDSTWGYLQNTKSKESNEPSPSNDYWRDLLAWRPPTGLGKNKVFWASLLLWFCLVGAALYLQD